MRINSGIAHSDSAILGGEPVFVGTRVPVTSLFEWLEGGETLDEWLANFPGVTRDQAVSVLEDAKALAVAAARVSQGEALTGKSEVRTIRVEGISHSAPCSDAVPTA